MFEGLKDLFKTKSGGLRSVPDFIYWNGLFVLWTAQHYHTKTQGTALEGFVEFFITVWLASFAVLIALKLWAHERGENVTLDFDDNIQRWHLDYIVVGLFGVEIIALATAILASQTETLSQQLPFMVMYVPRLSTASAGFSFYDDILFNFGLVASAEELSKLVTQRLLYYKLGNTPNGQKMSILAPILFWSMLHGYKSYTIYGELAMWVLIIGAFFSGIVMYWAWKETENYLVATIIHSIHNSIVVITPILTNLFS